MTDPNKPDTTDERLDAWLAQAPMLPASPAFSARVMRAIEARPLLWRTRLRRFWLAPHTLRWNFAGVLASLVLVLNLGIGALLLTRMPPGTSPVEAAPPGAMMVHFEFRQPQAQQVALAGDFTGWQAGVLLRRNPDGTWSAEVPLAPGDYEYVFVVDGERWVADPHALHYRKDGFGNRNAVINVPVRHGT